MVDNILRDSEEVGHGSEAGDSDLSGDEVKTPIFVIQRDNQAAQMIDESATGQQMADGEEEKSEDEDDRYPQFVQEEYDLANNLEQMITRLDSFDEYKHVRELVK